MRANRRKASLDVKAWWVTLSARLESEDVGHNHDKERQSEEPQRAEDPQENSEQALIRGLRFGAVARIASQRRLGRIGVVVPDQSPRHLGFHSGDPADDEDSTQLGFLSVRQRTNALIEQSQPETVARAPSQSSMRCS